MIEAMLLLSMAMPSPSPGPSSPDFRPLRRLLESWEFTTEYAISVGTADGGQLFEYESGNFTMHTSIPTGSTSKWPSAMMFASLVSDGTIGSLDDLVSKYLPYWTTSPDDKRSLVTFRMLLTFTSGFGGGHPGDEGNGRAARQWRARNRRAPEPEPIVRVGAGACNERTGNITACGRSIYEGVKLVGTPGEVYSYNSYHLQLAAAVAVAASGLPIQQVVQKYLVEPYGMHNSSYPGACPEFAASLLTTGADYERFLHGVLTYSHPSRDVILASERDGTPFLADEYTLYGDYGFGHFLFCFDSWDGFTPACKEAGTHVDPGAFGFIPMLDRKNGYYLQVVAAEIAPTGSYPLSGIPEYLAVAIKKHVDAILSPSPPDNGAHFHYTPSLLSLGVADVNYILDCKLHPMHCL